MPKTFQFNHNDMVTVILTKEGAEFLSRKRKEFYDTYPQIKNRGKEVFVEGEVYRTQFWSLITDFHEMMQIGMQSPFEFGKITVESSFESEGANMKNFEQKGKTISEIRTAKVQLERDILALVSKFEQENDIHVAYISTEEIHQISKPIPETIAVSVDFRL